jgi:hypothetical protein
MFFIYRSSKVENGAAIARSIVAGMLVGINIWLLTGSIFWALLTAMFGTSFFALLFLTVTGLLVFQTKEKADAYLSSLGE